MRVPWPAPPSSRQCFRSLRPRKSMVSCRRALGGVPADTGGSLAPSLLSSGLSPARVWTGSRAGCRPRQRRGSALAPAHLSPHPCPTMLCGDLGPGRSTPRAKALCWGHVVGQAIADERVTGEEGVEASRCPRRSHLRSQTQLSAQAPRPPAGLGPPEQGGVAVSRLWGLHPPFRVLPL